MQEDQTKVEGEAEFKRLVAEGMLFRVVAGPYVRLMEEAKERQSKRDGA